jgi:hypothetical protein
MSGRVARQIGSDVAKGSSGFIVMVNPRTVARRQGWEYSVGMDNGVGERTVGCERVEVAGGGSDENWPEPAPHIKPCPATSFPIHLSLISAQ